MKTALLTITIAALLLTLLTVFLPEGKTRKYIFGVMRLIIFAIILLPIISLFNNENIDLNEETFFMPTTTVEYKDDLLLKLTENELKKQGIDCRVEVTEEVDERYVDIYLQESVINESEGNIYKNSKTVIDTVEKYTGIGADRIRVWSK